MTMTLDDLYERYTDLCGAEGPTLDLERFDEIACEASCLFPDARTDYAQCHGREALANPEETSCACNVDALGYPYRVNVERGCCYEVHLQSYRRPPCQLAAGR